MEYIHGVFRTKVKGELPIYQDAARYDAEHWWKVDDVPFWEEMARENGPKILELAAGTGRLALPILKTDAVYTGLEVSKSFVKRAREKIAKYGDRGRIFQGDIRRFHLKQTFDLIFIGFNSFLHLLTDNDANRMLACMREHCHSETRFMIDMFVPDPLFLYRPEGKRVPAKIYVDPATNDNVSVEETNRYDPDTELNHLRWYYSTKKMPDFLVADFTLRMYFPDTMDRLLHEAGFQIIEKWGNYQRIAFREDCELQIYMARVAA
jgi:SAM-dependent methyltransferase